MKNKLFKAVKSMLSIAVAFAVILVSLFFFFPAINLKASAATVEDTWDGTKVKPTKTDASGNILIENAEQHAWIALEASPEETKDKNYKVVDNAVFNLNGMTDVTLDTTAGEVSGATATGNNWAGTKKTFAGNFDGNGVVIYNMYAPGSGYGAYGVKNSSYYWIDDQDKYSAVVRDRWTPETAATATYPRLTVTEGANNFVTSDFWMYSTRRFDLAKVQLTYEMPQAVLRNNKVVKGFSAYISGSNLLTISPERKHMEMNVGSAPQARFYNLGVKLGF